MIEENVDVETTQAEEVAAAKVGLEGETSKGASTVLGKFKDVDALAKAYESLQAEFTRRSQKLRKLEKEAENFFSRKEESGAEKLRKTALSRREAAKAFDEFVAEVGTPNLKKPDECLQEAGEGLSATEQVVEESEEGKGETQEGTLELPKNLQNQEKNFATFGNRQGKEEVLSAEELFRRATEHEGVRLRIVGEYLASLGKPEANLMRGGVGAFATPPKRAKTVGQAGDMALLYFKKNTVD